MSHHSLLKSPKMSPLRFLKLSKIVRCRLGINFLDSENFLRKKKKINKLCLVGPSGLPRSALEKSGKLRLFIGIFQHCDDVKSFDTT